jgi:hypothetical protein
MVASALYFYGPFIDVPDQAEIDFGSGDLTIDAWVWPPPPTGAGTGVSPIVDKLDLAQQRGYALYLAHAPGGPYNVPTFRIGTGTFTTAAAAVSLTYGMWNHVAVTVNAPPRTARRSTSTASPPASGRRAPATPTTCSRCGSAAAGSAHGRLRRGGARRDRDLRSRAHAARGAGDRRHRRRRQVQAAAMPGDCDGDARVGIDEIVRGL